VVIAEVDCLYFAAIFGKLSNAAASSCGTCWRIAWRIFAGLLTCLSWSMGGVSYGTALILWSLFCFIDLPEFTFISVRSTYRAFLSTSGRFILAIFICFIPRNIKRFIEQCLMPHKAFCDTFSSSTALAFIWSFAYGQVKLCLFIPDIAAVIQE